jgi:tetratricopeptide (TPR) repeat protein
MPPGERRPLFAVHGSALPSARETRVLTWLAGLLAVAFVLGMLGMIFGPHRVGDAMTETDFYGAYAEGALMIQGGRIDPSRYGVIGPGYEVALALVGFLVPDLFLAAGLLSLVSATVALLLWFRIVAGRADARVALLACAVLVTNGHFLRFGYSATTDALALSLQSLALWLILERSRTRAAVVAGVVAALAFLTRYNGIFLLPAGALILALGGGAPAAGRTRRDRLRVVTAYAAGFIVVAGAWMLFARAHGATTGSQLHHNIAFEVFGRPQGILWDDYQRRLQPEFHSLADVIARDPRAVVSRLAANLSDHLRLDARDLLGWPVALSALVGLLVVAVSGAWRRLWPIGLAASLLYLTLVPVFHSSRYSLALLPVYATLAGACFGLPWLALALGRGPRVWLKPLLASIPLAMAAASASAFIRQSLAALPVEVVSVSSTLRTLRRDGDRVIARKGHLGYYAGLETVPFPFVNGLDSLAAYARERRARWLYASWIEAMMRPAFGFLLDTTASVPGLTLRHFTAHRPAALYEIGPEFGTRPAWWSNDTLRSWHAARGRLLIDPLDADALYACGVIAHARGDATTARDALDRLVRIEPDNVSALLTLGEAALIARDLERARSAFERVARLKPESVAAQLGLGWVHVTEGDEEAAARRWRPVIEQTHDDITLRRMRDVFRSRGDGEAVARVEARWRNRSTERR